MRVGRTIKATLLLVTLAACRPPVPEGAQGTVKNVTMVNGKKNVICIFDPPFNDIAVTCPGGMVIGPGQRMTVVDGKVKLENANKGDSCEQE